MGQMNLVLVLETMDKIARHSVKSHCRTGTAETGARGAARAARVIDPPGCGKGDPADSAEW